MTAWRSNEEVSESGSSAAKNNPDGMGLGKGTGFGDIQGTATVIHKDEELPYVAGNGFGEVGDGTSAVDAHGMKLEGDSDASEPKNRNVADQNNTE